MVRLSTVIFALILGSAALGRGTAQAAPQYSYGCDYCHQMPPLDATTVEKDADNGAVPGNHQRHASQGRTSCAKCHGTQVGSYLTDHRNGMIELSDSLNYSRKPVGGFLNQTSVPPVPLGYCATAYCHTNGKGEGKVTPSWASPPFNAPADCSQCHDVAPNTGSHPVAGSKHAGYFGTDTGSCGKCHADHAAAAKPFAHATSAGQRGIEVRFAGGGSFTGTQCTNLYCHSNGKGTYAPPTWGGSLDCSGCHGTATSTGQAQLSGKHQNHVNNAAFLGTNYGCVECHALTVSGNSTIADRTRHDNGTIDVAGSRVGSVSAGTCSTSYCHSDGKGTQKTVLWTQAQSLDCTGCHGSDGTPAFASVAGEPNYASAGAGLPRANTHHAHVGAASDCSKCHFATTDGSGKLTGASHTNGAIDVTFNAAVAGASANYNTTTRTCSSVACHSDGTSVATGVAAGGTAVWGTTGGGCSACHGYPPAYPNNAPKANSHPAHAYGCNTCHAGTTADGSTISNPTLHGNGVYNLAPGSGITFSYVFAASGGRCTNVSCHGGVDATWGSSAQGHLATLGSGAILMGFTDAQYDHPTDLAPVEDCTLCHYANLQTQHAGKCQVCHAGSNPAGNLGAAWNGTCQQGACHPTFHTAMTAEHNGVYNGSSSSCDACHGTDIGGVVDCRICHDPVFSANSVGDHQAPVTTSDAKATYLLAGGTYATIRLTATDAGTSGVSYTRYKLTTGTRWTAGNSYSFGPPASGSRSYTLLFYSADHAMNVEGQKSVTFTVVRQ